MSQRELNLIAHAQAEKKIVDLQKLGFIGEDGAYHGNEMLQKLAYLGEDGDVKHVNHGMLGATAPMNLMSIEDHAEAEQNVLRQQAVERANQAEWKKTQGMTGRERKLIAHAQAEKKILDLQKLGYIGEDGAYHGNNMLTKKNLMNLAYLNEQGEVKGSQNGLLGAVAPMNLSEDGDFETGSVGSIESDQEDKVAIANEKALRAKWSLKKHAAAEKKLLKKHAAWKKSQKSLRKSSNSNKKALKKHTKKHHHHKEEDHDESDHEDLQNLANLNSAEIAAAAKAFAAA